MPKAQPLSLKLYTSFVILFPSSASKTSFNLPGPGTIKSVALY